MSMNENKDLMPAVIKAVKSVCPDKGMAVGPETQIMTEIDLDSLAMLELIGDLKAQFGTDFLDPKHSIEDLLSPETIVAAILNERAEKSGAR